MHVKIQTHSYSLTRTAATRPALGLIQGMVLQQVNAIATESGEFRDRHAADGPAMLASGLEKAPKWFMRPTGTALGGSPARLAI
eukprot:COSAG05_NODE_2733_length_2714_cov_13.830210_3_plen_84_part_00